MYQLNKREANAFTRVCRREVGGRRPFSLDMLPCSLFHWAVATLFAINRTEGEFCGG